MELRGSEEVVVGQVEVDVGRGEAVLSFESEKIRVLGLGLIHIVWIDTPVS
jgi:hypothetical protein